MLPKNALNEFKEIFKEEFGIDLTEEETSNKASAVLDLFRILASKEDADKLDLPEVSNDD